MGSENVDRYHGVLDTWNRGDLDGLVGMMDGAVEIFTVLAGVEGAYRGHEGVRRWWQDFHNAFPDWNTELLAIRAVGDGTLAQLRLTGHGGESGVPIDQTIWHVVRWRDGKAVRVSRHDSEADALEAVGPPE